MYVKNPSEFDNMLLLCHNIQDIIFHKTEVSPFSAFSPKLRFTKQNQDKVLKKIKHHRPVD